MMKSDLKILAVDDDPAIRSLLAAIFENAGLQSRVVGDLAEFHAALKTEDANICLVDIGLPDGDGLSLVAELHRQGGRGVVILTGRGNEVDQVLGLEIGADDYVVKPFRQRELLARLNAVARRVLLDTGQKTPSTAQTDPTTELFGYQINLNARTVTGPDQRQVNLTTAEFDVLAVLLAHRGESVSRDVILAETKGASWNSAPRAADGLISRLRKKLPIQDKDKDLIKTLHGKGYMLAPKSD
ncbi:Transcriptional regulatory protein OmpR [Roseibaca ekhonensis]|uniref:Transcriptional regulatory protein OmpR n=1 Tax=Roseinatronobacter ekhonensis TaxID=254356 RepID=A0A3B0MPM2_9RHOB|nr:response regulator transcription factor [Roseibaca ekhonensis]SUZ32957.1 Transcriptional regulatory protein OmpR [Roseibaca ekhonensis]